MEVFLCYNTEDKDAVSNLYEKLQGETDVKPWMDDKDLLSGRSGPQIRAAMKRADCIVVCVSNRTTVTEGAFISNIRNALDIARTKQDSAAFIIPVRLNDCSLPSIEGLSDWKSMDYFVPDGYEKLLEFLRKRVTQLEETSLEPDHPQPQSPTPHKAQCLIGYLTAPTAANKFSQIERIMCYAVVKSTGSFNFDCDDFPNNSAIVNQAIQNLDDEKLERFAVICLDFAQGLGLGEITGKIKKWFVSSYPSQSIEEVRGDLSVAYGSESNEALPRAIIEIAWDTKKMEAYLRFGIVRQPVEIPEEYTNLNYDTKTGRRSVSRFILHLLETELSKYEIVAQYLDHVQVFVNKDVEQERTWPWEFKPNLTPDMKDIQERLQRYPVVVRFRERAHRNEFITDRNFEIQNIACCVDSEQEFKRKIRTYQVFALAQDSSNYLDIALKLGCVGVWNRRKTGDVEDLKQELAQKNIHDIPRTIHAARLISKPDDVTRDVVLLFDHPSLPPFKFKSDNRITDAQDLIEINRMI